MKEEKPIVSPLVSKLSWTHFLIVMTLKDELQREFYLTMAAAERWSKRTLQLDKAGIKVAKYITELPPREVLQRQIQKSLEAAKARFENLIEEDEA